MEASVAALGECSATILVARIAAGDAAAEQELVRRYSRVVLYVLRRRVGDIDLARDLHQDTFVLVLTRLRAAELREPEALPAFVRQVAMNVATAQDRRTHRRRTDTDTDAIEAIADDAQSALDVVERNECFDLVRRSIDALERPRDRDLLVRYFVDLEDKPSICAALGLSTTHFDRVLHRAKARLRALLGVSTTAEEAAG